MSPVRKAEPKRRRRARGSLNEEEIISAAIELIERDGAEGLSMPGLAKHLNAGVMSVYWYFHSKEDLLLAVADRAFLDVYSRNPPITDGPWDEEITNVTTAMLRILRSNSLYLQLCRVVPRCLVLRPTVIPVLARRLEAELALFQHGSVSAPEASRFIIVVGAYLRGFALMQLSAEEERNGHTPEEAIEALVRQLNPAKFPMLRAASDAGKVVSVSDESFATGLRLMVAGLKAVEPA